ncbi:MAG: hypothetical protein ACKVZH_17920 [Blastocatellia bacterium]
MRQIPVLSGLWNFLTAPDLPRTALAISETHLSIVTLKRSRGEFEPRNLGVLRLPDGLVKSSFSEPNISNEAALIEQLNRTANQAGITRPRALSVALPPGSARSQVVALDSNPGSNKELMQVLEWKIERTFGQKFDDLKTSHSRLNDFNGRPQWLVSAVHKRVLEQYERVFKQLRWPVGLVLPPHLGEAQWLMRQGLSDDQAIVSLNERGFTAVIVRGDEPILVREVECSPEEREDEFFRIIVFYRDRLLPETDPIRLSRVLTLGTAADQRSFREVVTAALETHAVALDVNQIGLRVDSTAPFNHFAAASGLATMAWGY